MRAVASYASGELYFAAFRTRRWSHGRRPKRSISSVEADAAAIINAATSGARGDRYALAASQLVAFRAADSLARAAKPIAGASMLTPFQPMLHHFSPRRCDSAGRGGRHAGGAARCHASPAKPCVRPSSCARAPAALMHVEPELARRFLYAAGRKKIITILREQYQKSVTTPPASAIRRHDHIAQSRWSPHFSQHASRPVIDDAL